METFAIYIMMFKEWIGKVFGRGLHFESDEAFGHYSGDEE